MKILKVVPLLFLICLCKNFVVAQEVEKITWLTHEWPPYFINSGIHANKGRADNLTNILIKYLPQYDHVRLEMNWVRYWRDIKKGKNFCNPASYKNASRQEYAVFSLPNEITIPLSIIILKKNAKKFGSVKSYSLKKLLERKELTTKLESSRSYSKYLDEMLNEKIIRPNIARVKRDSKYLLNLLYHDRIDYLIEYPIVTNYHWEIMSTEHSGFDENDFITIQIKELPEYLLSYISCAKNDWGKKVISDINRVLKKITKTPEYLDIQMSWHKGKHIKEIIMKAYKKHMK